MSDKALGDKETCYGHVVTGYLYPLALKTWDDHRLGLGIFNMQGFERRNKENKNCFRRFTNGKGNFIMQCMKRLWDVFNHGKNAY